MFFCKKNFAIVLLSLFLFLVFSNIAFAQRPLEVRYPPVPDPSVLVPSSTKTALPEYIKYAFTLAISIAGLIAFASLIYGGVRYVTSSGNPSQMSDAQGQMFAGALGLLLLVSSYVILSTINPQLTVLKAETAPSLGVTLINGAGEQKRVGVSITDLEDFNPTQITFQSRPEQLEVTIYGNTNMGGGNARISGPGNLPLADIGGTVKSIKLSWIATGVYLYGSSPEEQMWTDTNLPSINKLNDNIQKIVFKGGLHFGAILHEDSGYQGQCRIFLNDSEDNIKGNQTTSGKIDGASSATVFLRSTDVDAGAKVEVCTQPDHGGICKNITDAIRPDFEIAIPRDIRTFGNEYNDSIRSIYIEGNYLVVLTENAPGEGNFPGKCEVFNQRSAADLKNDPIGMCDVDCFLFWCQRKPCTSGIAIYPIRK